MIAQTDNNSYYLDRQLNGGHSSGGTLAIEKSDFKADVSVENEDKLVTLSTCAYDFKDARYVVLGKLVEWQESK